MFEFLHTSKCTNCGEIYQTKEYNENAKCKCGSELQYRGLQQKMDELTLMMEKWSQSFSTKKEEKREELKIEVNDTKEEKQITFENGVVARQISFEEMKKIEKENYKVEQQIEVIKELDKTENNLKIIETQIEDKKEPKLTGLTIDMVLDTSSKITNAKVVPALKEAIAENSIEKVLLIQKHYPKEYTSSLKYIGKRNTTKLNEMLGTN